MVQTMKNSKKYLSQFPRKTTSKLMKTRLYADLANNQSKLSQPESYALLQVTHNLKISL